MKGYAMSEFSIVPTQSKREVINLVEKYLTNLSLNISDRDEARPCGAFFVISQESTKDFIAKYFSDIPESEIFQYGENISPKILLVEPGQKLSWQYHDRRAELWKVVSGPIGVIRSESDIQGDVEEIPDNSLITHGAGMRHRLVGLNNWGVVAEIWQHTDHDNLSNEEDIVRLEDSYGRN